MKELTQIESLSLPALRDQVMERLTQHFSLDLISMEEYELRAREVAQADSKPALIALVADLPPLPSEAMQPRQAARTGPRPGAQWQVGTERMPANDNAICVFGATERKGVWRVPRNLETLCVFGGATIDLRKAIVPPEGATVHCLAFFGGVDIIVPPGMRLEVSGTGIMGGFDHAQNDLDDPDAPLIRVEGLAIFGGVTVRLKD